MLWLHLLSAGPIHRGNSKHTGDESVRLSTELPSSSAHLPGLEPETKIVLEEFPLANQKLRFGLK